MSPSDAAIGPSPRITALSREHAAVTTLVVDALPAGPGDTDGECRHLVITTARVQRLRVVGDDHGPVAADPAADDPLLVPAFPEAIDGAGGRA
jgi:hypothetical protein